MSKVIRMSRVWSCLVAVSLVGTFGSSAHASTLGGPPRAGAHTAVAMQGGQYVEAARWLTDGRPNAIAIGPDGSVVVTQATDDKVSRFDQRGTQLGTFALGFGYPYGVAVDPAGQVHVTQYSGFDSTAQVHMYSSAGGHLRSYGVPEGASTQFSPWGMALHPDGTAFVANPVGADVQLVRPDGSWGGRLGGPGSGPGQFDGPRDVALGNGSLYVVDTGNRRVQRFDPTTGELQAIWGQSGYGEGQFLNPQSIDVAPDGRVLVLDRNGPDAAVLNQFTAAGDFLGRTTLPLSQAFAMAVDAAGAVYVTGLVSYPSGGWGVLKVVPSDASPTPPPTSPPMPPPTSPPMPPTASKAKVMPKRIDAVKSRQQATMRIACSAGTTRCAGKVKVQQNGKILARGTYTVAAGRKAKAAVRLTAPARRLLSARKSVKVRLRLQATTGVGGTTRIRLTR